MLISPTNWLARGQVDTRQGATLQFVVLLITFNPPPLLVNLRKKYQKCLGGTTKGGRQRRTFPNFNPDRIFHSKNVSCPNLCHGTIGSVVSPPPGAQLDFPISYFHGRHFYVETFQFPSLCQKLMPPLSENLPLIDSSPLFQPELAAFSTFSTLTVC